MTARILPSLGLVAQESPPGILGMAEAVVARPGEAGAAPFLLEGERMAVTGAASTGAQAFWLGARLVAERLSTDLGRAASVVAAPASLRRELVGGGSSVLELTLVAPTLPLAAVQWQPPPGGRWSGAMSVALVLFPGAREVSYHVSGGGLRCVQTADSEETVVELRLHPIPEEWRVGEAAGGGLQVRASLASGSPVTLVLAAGSPRSAAQAMAAAPHLSAHELRSAIDADPGAQETLTPLTGMRAVDHGVVWATARVRLGLLRGAPGPAADVFWAGLGALAAGDVAAARAAVGALLSRRERSVVWRLEGRVSAQALATLLAARLTLLTGEAVPALEARRRLCGAGVPGDRPGADPAPGSLWSLALGTLADALRFAAAEKDTASLRREAGGLDAAGALQRLLAGEGEAPELCRPDALLGAWAMWSSQEPDAAWTAWRTLLARGFEGGPGGRGTWDAEARPPGVAPEAGILLCGLAHGFLGLAPDAPSGRIRIAPALPAHLSAFGARGIRVGDARMEVSYQREGRLHTLRVEPTAGRVPVTVVLEPSLSTAGIEAVRVDGKPAHLDTVASEKRVRLRLQVVLDAPRSLEVEAAPPAHAGHT